MRTSKYCKILNNNFQASEFTYACQPNKIMDILIEKVDFPDNLKRLCNSDTKYFSNNSMLVQK